VSSSTRNLTNFYKDSKNLSENKPEQGGRAKTPKGKNLDKQKVFSGLNGCQRKQQPQFIAILAQEFQEKITFQRLST